MPKDKKSTPGTPPVLGIIGGSGLYEIDGLEKTEWIEVASPFGTPSDAILRGELDGQILLFLPRHGRGHRLPPGDIDYRANIDALKRAGATEILSLSAVGSLRELLEPGLFVLVDQFVDRTFAREKSFFGPGMVAHVSMARPVCGRLGRHLAAAASALDQDLVLGGTYLAMEGPQFSSFAESELYRSWGCDIIGMTNMPEAKLAREAELCYASIAMITDYDCWHDDHTDVTVEAIVKGLMENAEKARTLIKALAPRLHERDQPCVEGCHHSLESALVTAPEARDPVLVARLDAVAGRLLAPKD